MHLKWLKDSSFFLKTNETIKPIFYLKPFLSAVSLSMPVHNLQILLSRWPLPYPQSSRISIYPTGDDTSPLHCRSWNYFQNPHPCNTLSLCIFSTLSALFFRNHSIGAIDDFLKNRQQKKQPMLLDCHIVTLARLFLSQKFVSIA